MNPLGLPLRWQKESHNVVLPFLRPMSGWRAYRTSLSEVYILFNISEN